MQQRSSGEPRLRREVYDDNEVTSWTNASVTRTNVDADSLPSRHAEPDQRPVNATLADAWTEYTFEKANLPTQVNLKPGSFRLRRYPLRITLDGSTLYEGLTPTSLGCITCRCGPPGQAPTCAFNLWVAYGRGRDSYVHRSEWHDRSGGSQKEEALPVPTVIEAEFYAPP